MKSKQIRSIAFYIHRYIGLGVGLLAAAIGLTGSLLSLHAVQSILATPRISVGGERLPMATLIANAKAAMPQVSLESINFPEQATEPLSVWWMGAQDTWFQGVLNPYTGQVQAQASDEAYTKLLYDIHINLLGGEWGAYVAGIVGLLATILSITGIMLWPGWRKLSAGFKIKWKATLKRLTFDLHKVAGIIAAVFLSLAMLTGFIWNFGTWMQPLIYGATFSPLPKEQEFTSRPGNGREPLVLTDELIQSVTGGQGKLERIVFPTDPNGVYKIRTKLEGSYATATLDRYSGQVLHVENDTSLGYRIYDLFPVVHFGTFAGIYSRIFYIFVGLSPSILLATGFIMWLKRRKAKPQPERVAELVEL
jgi:uncharacterized iron-regulated membrane protein